MHWKNMTVVINLRRFTKAEKIKKLRYGALKKFSAMLASPESFRCGIILTVKDTRFFYGKINKCDR